MNNCFILALQSYDSKNRSAQLAIILWQGTPPTVNTTEANVTKFNCSPPCFSHII